MHIEKKFFGNIFHTIEVLEGKTKDNVKVRIDSVERCKLPEMAHCVGLNGKLKLLNQKQTLPLY